MWLGPETESESEHFKSKGAEADGNLMPPFCCALHGSQASPHSREGELSAPLDVICGPWRGRIGGSSFKIDY